MLLSLINKPLAAGSKNGFVLDGALIPESQILRGGPDKGGIPAIDEPRFLLLKEAKYLHNEDRVLGIVINNIARAYPVKILNWHEIVNDRIGREFFSITYCPLCGTGMAFSAMVNKQQRRFGVSGLLYNSDVLLYDLETESLWSQISSKAIAGQHKGDVLKPLPLEHTSWGNWKAKYPKTTVLSNKTGYWRDYDKNPYQDYEQSRALYFSVANTAPSYYHPKERILGLVMDGVAKAWPFVELNKHGGSVIKDSINNKAVTIHWNQEHQSGTVIASNGELLPAIQGFWFAWYAFHPDTLVFKAK